MKLTGGIRAVAATEAVKGAVVLLAGTGLLALVHHDAQAWAEAVVQRLHLNPANHLPRIFVDAAAHLNDSRLRFLALLAAVYSLARFVESYGLWRQRRWAEWIGVISGAIYIPWELVELSREVSWLRLTILGVNVLIVWLLAFALWESRTRPVR